MKESIVLKDALPAWIRSECSSHKRAVYGLLVVFLSGCMATSTMDREQVATDISDLTGYPIAWDSTAGYEDALEDQVGAMLSDSMAVEDVIQVTLINNRKLLALYESVGVAQAELIQAGLFENPTLDTHIGYPVEEDHAADLGFSLSFNVLDFFHVPLRKAVAASLVEETTQRISRDVLQTVADVQEAYYTYLAALQKEELVTQISQNLNAAYQAASMLRDAGNIRDLDLFNEQAFYEQAQLDVAYATLSVLQAREALNQLMGLWGESAESWHVTGRLPELDVLPAGIEQAEPLAIEASLDLAIMAQELNTLAQQEGVVNATALLPHLKLGMDAEREEAWEIGPGIGFPVPLFDQGQAQKASIKAQIKQMQASYYGKAVDIRSSTRAMRQELVTTYRLAQHYRDTIVPLSSRISVGTQEQYNAMQIGVFELLTARQQEITAGKEYIDTLLAYWLSRSRYEMLLKGVMPAGSRAPSTSVVATSTRTRPSKDH